MCCLETYFLFLFQAARLFFVLKTVRPSCLFWHLVLHICGEDIANLGRPQIQRDNVWRQRVKKLNYAIIFNAKNSARGTDYSWSRFLFNIFSQQIHVLYPTLHTDRVAKFLSQCQLSSAYWSTFQCTVEKNGCKIHA